MSNSLFRKEVPVALNNKLTGSVFLAPKVSHGVTATFLVIWLTVLLVWLARSNVTTRESVKGWIEPKSGVVKVFATHANQKIKDMYVKEGDFVEKGTPLLALTSVRYLPEQGTTSADAMFIEYSSQLQMLASQKLDVTRLAELRLNATREDFINGQKSLVHLNRQIEFAENRVELLRARSVKLSASAENGLIPMTEVGNALIALNTAVGEVLSLEREKIVQENKIATMQSELALIPLEMNNANRDLKNKESTLRTCGVTH
jgi:membrane fusion protein